MTVLFPSNDIPWNEERFNEIFWSDLPQNSTTTTTYDGNSGAACNITVSVSQLETNYNVSGNGEIGTTVTGSATYNWSVNGSVQVGGIPVQTINESHSWTYSWSWKRIS